MTDIPKSRKVGKLKDKPVYRVTVRVSQSGVDRDYYHAYVDVEVLAHSVAEAVNFIRDTTSISHPTEFTAVGPKGGLVKRFVGWESLIGREILGYRLKHPETGRFF